MFDEMIKAKSETEEISYSAKIYDAAIRADKIALDQLLLDVNICCSDSSGLYPSTRLASEGNITAIQFLQQHYALKHLGLAVGFGMANDTLAITDLLSACNEPEIKRELIESIIYGLAYGRHLHECDVYIAAYIILNDSKDNLIKAHQLLAFAYGANNNIEDFNILLRKYTENNLFLILKEAIRGFGIYGNLDMIKNLMMEALIDSDEKELMELYQAGVKGLAFGNHLIELKQLMQLINTDYHYVLMISMAEEFARTLQINNIKIMLDVENINRKEILSTAMAIIIESEHAGPAKQIFSFAKDQEERKLMLNMLILYLAKLNRHNEVIAVNETETLDIFGHIIDFKFSNGLTADVEKMLDEELPLKHRAQLLQQLMIHHAMNGDYDKAIGILKIQKDASENGHLIRCMIYSFVAHDHIKNAKSYLRSVSNKSTKFNLLKELVLDLLTNETFGDANTVCEIGNDLEEKKHIGIEAFNYYFNLRNYEAGFLLIKNIALVELKVLLTGHAVYQYSYNKNMEQVTPFLSEFKNSIEHDKISTEMMKGLLRGKHLTTAMAEYQQSKSPTQRIIFRAILVTEMSKEANLSLLSKLLSEFDSLPELKNLIEKSIDKKALYGSTAFATNDRAIKSLALIKNDRIRKLLAIDLQAHKKDSNFNTDALLPQAEKLHNVVKKVVSKLEDSHRLFKNQRAIDVKQDQQAIEQLRSVTP